MIKLLEKANTKVYILALIFIGFAVFGGSLFNSFIGDDLELVVNNSQIQSISNIPKLFVRGSFYDEANQRNNYYKPLLTVVISLIYFFSSQNPFGYHFFQISLHITNAILIFLFVKKFLKKETAFLLSLIFLVHPINTEAAVYISDLQENLFLFFGFISLYITTFKSEKRHYPFWLFLTLLASLLSKETGLLFLLMIPLFSYLFDKKNFTKSVVVDFFVSVVYLVQRFGIAHININNAAVPIVPIQNLNLLERLINTPKIFWYYLVSFFFPKNLISFQSWIITKPDLYNFYLPLTLFILFTSTILYGGLFLFSKKANYFRIYLFFAAWLFLGLIFHSQIIPLDQTVADRWFYFPIVGLLGTIFVFFNYLLDKKLIRPRVMVLIILVVTLFLSARTLIREKDWKNTESLVKHDIKLDQSSYQLEIGLGGMEEENNNLKAAELHYKRASDIFPEEKTFGVLGDFYLKQGLYEQAISNYTKEISYNPNYGVAWVYLAIAKYNKGDTKGALDAATKAYKISQNDSFLKVLQTIQKNEPISIQK